MSTQVKGFNPVTLKKPDFEAKPSVVCYTTQTLTEQEPDSVEIGGKKKLDKKTVAKGVGILAATAAITTGIVLAAKSGKFAGIGEILEGFKPKQNLSLEEFQQKGGFEGGIAKLKNKLFTGTITVNGKEGEVTTLTYKDGKITESLKQGVKSGDFYANITKQYSYAEDGTRTIVQHKGYNRDIYPLEKRTTAIFPDKTNIIITDTIYGGDDTRTKLNGTFFVDGKPRAVKIVPDIMSSESRDLVKDIKTGEEIIGEDAIRIIQEVNKFWEKHI